MLTFMECIGVHLWYISCSSGQLSFVWLFVLLVECNSPQMIAFMFSHSNTGCTIFGQPRQKITIMRESWWYFYILALKQQSYVVLGDWFKDGCCHSLAIKDSKDRVSEMWDDHLTVWVLLLAKRNDGDDDSEVSSRMSKTVILFVLALCHLYTAGSLGAHCCDLLLKLQCVSSLRKL